MRILTVGLVGCLGIYLFVSAPAPLPDKATMFDEVRVVEVEKMFNAVNAVNDAARAIYTERIVGAGLQAGLKFGEDWAEPGVEKGPLPALFLRLVASRMEAKPARLGLYLGSDAPINKSNLFGDVQATAFEQLKQTRQAIITSTSTSGFVGMYPDIASTAPCVSCHNDHPDSPKTDWELGDVMGATTWTYPTGKLGADEYLGTTEAFFAAVGEAYDLYLDKAAAFKRPILIGQGWPGDNHLILPDRATFMSDVRQKAAVSILEELILLGPLVPDEKAREVLN